MRKLASVQKILALFAIPEADLIEEAQVQGWRTVVKKGQFKVGDLCVFCEVDALLPDAPWCSFLKSKRIKTMKLKKVLSQGLVLPISILEGSFQEGDDVTEALGIKKYEAPEPSHNYLKGMLKGNFPSYVPKTDEERIQSAPHMLDQLMGRPYIITLKYDGTSFTAINNQDNELDVCSRNFALKNSEEMPDKYWQMAKKYKLEEVLKDTTLAIQAEMCGPGIQKNRLELKEHELFIFNIYDWKNGTYLTYTEMQQFQKQHPHLQLVSYEEIGESFNYNQEQLLEKAKGNYKGTDKRREGFVIRSLDEGPRVSFKVINNEFLLKDEE